MRWKNSHRKERFNPDWPRIRHEILERDRFACQWPVTDEFGFTHICAQPANEVDHKVRATNGVDDDSPETGRLLEPVIRDRRVRFHSLL